MNFTNIQQLFGSPVMILLLLVIGAGVVKALWSGGRAAGLPIEAKPLMTTRERQVIAYIEQAVPYARVHAQVCMGAILKTKRGLSNRERMSTRGRFSQKMIDYVLEDRHSGRILAPGRARRPVSQRRQGRRARRADVLGRHSHHPLAGPRAAVAARRARAHPYRPVAGPARRARRVLRPGGPSPETAKKEGSMSNWDFSDMGDFESEADADRWAKRNGVPHQDVRTRNTGRGVKIEVRRSALGDDGPSSADLGDGRRTGF